MISGQEHPGMAAALRQAEDVLAHGWAHTCDLATPLESLTADGHWYCLGCLYEEAWRAGYGAGLTDGMAVERA
jgi:hypothetical protein